MCGRCSVTLLPACRKAYTKFLKQIYREALSLVLFMFQIPYFWNWNDSIFHKVFVTYFPLSMYLAVVSGSFKHVHVFSVFHISLMRCRYCCYSICFWNEDTEFKGTILWVHPKSQTCGRPGTWVNCSRSVTVFAVLVSLRGQNLWQGFCPVPMAW